MRTVIGTALIGMIAVLLGGCAGGSSSGDQHMTKRAYIVRSDAICARAGRADDSIPDDTPLVEVLRRTHDQLRGALADLQALDRPAGDDRDLDEWFRALHQELAAVSLMQRAAEDGDHDRLFKTFDRASTVEGSLRRAAQRYGFHACAK